MTHHSTQTHTREGTTEATIFIRPPPEAMTSLDLATPGGPGCQDVDAESDTPDAVQAQQLKLFSAPSLRVCSRFSASASPFLFPSIFTTTMPGVASEEHL